MKKTQKSNKFLFVCQGKDCLKKGSKTLHKQLKQEIKKNRQHKEVQVLKCKCLDRCKFAPSVVYGHQWFGQVKLKDLDQILPPNPNDHS